MTYCVICTKPSQTAACDPCMAAVERNLSMVPWLAAQLLVTYSRQSRLGSAGKRPTGAEQPLGYGPGAKKAYDRLHNELVGWVREFLGRRLDEAWPRDDVVSMTVWLLRRRDRIQRHHAVDELARSIEHVVQHGLDRINPEADEPTYGICEADTEYGPCPGYLYGEAAASWVRCARCGAQHETAARREWMRHRMAVFYFRAATLARLLPRMIDRPVSASNIRNWAAEGRPIRTDRDSDGFPTYHCGDVIAVAAVTPKRQREGASPCLA